MDEQLFELVLQARAETAGAFTQVQNDLRMMGSEIQQQTRLAEAAFTEASTHTRLLHAAVGELATQTNLAAATYDTATAATAKQTAAVRASKAAHEEHIGIFGKFTEGILDVGKVAAGFVIGGLIQTGTASIAEHIQKAADEVMVFGNKVIAMQRLIGGSAADVSSFVATFDYLGVSSDQAGLRIAFFDKNLVNHIEGLEGGAAAHNAFVRTMQQLGVSTVDSTGHFRASKDVLLDTFDAISKLPSAEERTAATTNIFGRGGIALMPAIMRGKEGFEEIASGESTAGNRLDDSQLGMIRQFKEAQREMEAATRGASTQLGVLFLPAATAAASAAAGFASAINEHVVPAFHAIPAAISSILGLMNEYRVATAGVALVLTVALAPALYGAVVSFGAAAVAAGAAAIAMLAPFAPLILAVAAVIAVGVLLQKAWESNFGGIQSAMQPVIDWIQSHLPLIVGAIALVIAAILWIPTTLFLVYKAWTDDWGGIQETVSAAAGFISDRINELLAAIREPLEAIGTAFGQAWDGVQQVVAAAIDFIGSKISGLMDFLADHGLLGVQKSWRQDWANMVNDAAGGVAGIGSAVIDGASKAADAAGKTVQGAADAVGNTLHPKGKVEPAPPDNTEGPPVSETIPFGLTQKQIDTIGPAGIDSLLDLAHMKEATATAQDDLKGVEADLGNLRAAASERQLAFDQSQLSNQMQLLDLKRQGLVIDNQMQLPQEHLRDLALDLKQAAQDQVRLADEMRLLQLDAADFNQNADLKRIANQISQDQEQLDFTRSPAQAAALAADIERLKVQAHDIKVGMFGSQDARVEAEITASGDQLDVKLAQNPINQQIAAENAKLDPIIRQKNAIEDATKSLQSQADMAKLSYDAQELAAKPAILAATAHQQAIQAVIREQQAAYNQAVTQFVTDTATAGNVSPKDVRAILKQIGLSDSEADKAAGVTATLESLQDYARAHARTTTVTPDPDLTNHLGGGRTPDPDLTTHLGGSGPQIVINISNPVLTTDQNQQQVAAQMLAVLDHGLTEMIASGTPLPVWNGNPSGN